ncbi:AraC family transcriptional regulator [uncultured Alistipes sp.]|uniref:AraC family transcriptional regulator n=1 Tax=uncultured Alistipes sp. TaxID=538949 RepID=UPI0025CBDC1D|nr:AraC family transcriptional regulator [uncultured Alistipes sp.]
MHIEVGFPGERIVVIPQPFLDLIKDDPLTGDLYIQSLGQIAHARHHLIDRPGGCEAYTFIYCTWGAGYVAINGLKFALRANQYIVLPKGVPYSYGADENDPWSIYWVRFDGEKGKIYARIMSSPTTVLPSVYSRIEQRLDIFENAYAVLCGELSLERLNYANIAFAHFIASFLFVDLLQTSGDQPSHAEGMINRITHYMNENAERRLTLKDMARYAGYSESYFYRQFVRQTSMSPIDYFIRVKINKASIYLIKTSMTISQIAAKLGFGSADYFSRTFRRIVGISASEFRKQDFRL